MSVESVRQTKAAVSERSPSVVAAVVSDLRLLLIGTWLGAALFFSFGVAPTAFSVLRSASVTNANELAGSIVTRTLSFVNVSGFAIALVLLATAFSFSRGLSRAPLFAELVSLVMLAAATSVGHWIINSRMLALRLSMGRPIDEVAKNDPIRSAFDQLHGHSVSALGLGMLVALVALLLIARRGRGPVLTRTSS
jgi:hypothetical protein